MWADLRVTEASWHWLTEVGHRDHCACPSNSRVHRSLTILPGVHGGYIPRTGHRRNVVAVSLEMAESIHACADVACMIVCEMADSDDAYPVGAQRSLRALSKRAAEAARHLRRWGLRSTKGTP